MLSIQSINRRGEVREKVKALIEAGTGLEGVPVLFSREQPENNSHKFINVYFLAGDVEQGFQRREDSGKLVVRIGLRTTGDVDASLDAIAVDIVKQLGDGEGRLEDSVDEFSEIRWEYGAPENSTVSFLALIYTVEYTEQL